MKALIKLGKDQPSCLRKIRIHKENYKIRIDKLHNEDKYHNARSLQTLSFIANQLDNHDNYIPKDEVEEYYGLTATQVNQISNQVVILKCIAHFLQKTITT